MIEERVKLFPELRSEALLLECAKLGHEHVSLLMIVLILLMLLLLLMVILMLLPLFRSPSFRVAAGSRRMLSRIVTIIIRVHLGLLKLLMLRVGLGRLCLQMGPHHEAIVIHYVEICANELPTVKAIVRDVRAEEHLGTQERARAFLLLVMLGKLGGV